MLLKAQRARDTFEWLDTPSTDEVVEDRTTAVQSSGPFIHHRRFASEATHCVPAPPAQLAKPKEKK